MAKSTMVCAGIDTGKRKLDAALGEGRERRQVDNSPAGHSSLSGWLRRHRVKRVGIEASGGYEAPVVAELRRAGFVVILFQPAQVRAYARFVLQRAKNDRIDAELIARRTAAAERVYAPPDPRLAPLAEHLAMLGQRRQAGIGWGIDPLGRRGAPRDQLGVDPVILRPLQDKPGIGPHLGRLKEDYDKPGAAQLGHHRCFVTAARLDADPLDPMPAQPPR